MGAPLKRAAALAVLPVLLFAVTAFAEGPPTSAGSEIRVFTIHHRSVHDASVLVGDLLGPAGSYKVQPGLGTIVVEDERERLDRIERMLADYDIAPPEIQLTVNLIRASARGEAEEDLGDEIRHVEQSLRDLTRWTRFNRIGSISLKVAEGASVQAEVPDTPFRVEFAVDMVQQGAGRVRLAPFRLLRERPDDAGEIKMVRVVGITGMNLSDGQMFTLVATNSERSPEALFVAMMARVQR
jgi:hypothetical protein